MVYVVTCEAKITRISDGRNTIVHKKSRDTLNRESLHIVYQSYASRQRLGLGHLGALAVTIGSVLTELFLDAEELVVLGHTVVTA